MRTFVTHMTACITIISVGGYRKLEVGTYLPKADPKLLVGSCLDLVNRVERLRTHRQGLAPNCGQYQWIRCKHCLPLHLKYFRLQC